MHQRLHLSTIQWLYQHGQAFSTSFSKMSQTPLATCLTLAVIGVALALPCILFVLLQNVERIGAQWENGTQISLYLNKSLSKQQALALQQRLSLDSQIESVRFVSAKQGLADFKTYSGFDDVLNELHDNPLPPVLIIRPLSTLTTTATISALVTRLQHLTEVQATKLDMAWINRLARMIELGQHLIYGLALLLGFAVILIIGNTIRLATQNQHQEIKIIQLVGGTDAFIRRPFLYTGALYGTIGGILSMVLVALFLNWLNEPVQRLAVLYNSHFHLIGLDNSSTLLLLACGMALGLLGSWLAVGHHLQAPN